MYMYTRSDLDNQQKGTNKNLIQLASQFMCGTCANSTKQAKNYSQNFQTEKMLITI